MTIKLHLEQLELRTFRNIEKLELSPVPRVNVISGNNGQGKTSLLEAIYLLATSRSFRSSRLGEIPRHGGNDASVRAQLREGDFSRAQKAVLHAGRKTLFINDNKQQKLSAYALRTPVVVFHPGNLDIVNGSASVRRTLLDRLALFIDPVSGSTRAAYQHALKERQTLLDRQGPSARELDAFEQIIAREGTLLSRGRKTALATLSDALHPAFLRIADKSLALRLNYVPGGTEDPQAFLSELQARRRQDSLRKRSSFGPHKDDVELLLNERNSRQFASQGQQRILALATKVAELEVVKTASGLEPLLLLDDVSSELDPQRTGAVYDFVRDNGSQVFVTTTRPELFQTPELEPSDRADFRLSAGALEST